MSVMKHTWAEINEVANIDIVQNPPQDFSNDPQVIRRIYGRFAQCQKRLEDISKHMKKFETRAKEPEKQWFYGPKTNAEILEYIEKYEAVKIIVNEQISRWLPFYLPLSEADEAKRLVQEEEVRKMEKMRREAMLPLEKMEQERVINE